MILIVEDHDDTRAVIARLLCLHGHPVETASDGPAALARLADAAAPLPALVVLDLNLPQMSGLEILASIRQIAGAAALPVLVYTAAEDERTRRAAECLGIAGYVKKGSIDWPTLLQRIRDIVGGPEIATA